MQRLPDILGPDLRCVFVGINPGIRSAEAGHHFANPRNDFWRLLAESGLTSTLLEPHQQLELLDHGLGITNAARRVTRGSGELRRTDFADAPGAAGQDRARADAGRVRLRRQAGLLRRLRRAGRPRAAERRLEGRPLFVLPSTSPANAAVPFDEKLRWFRELRALADQNWK